jgi:hypothetical protein
LLQPGLGDIQRPGLWRPQGGVEGRVIYQLQPLDGEERVVARADDRRLRQRRQPVGIQVLRDLVDVDDLLALGLDDDGGFGLVERGDAADIEADIMVPMTAMAAIMILRRRKVAVMRRRSRVSSSTCASWVGGARNG